MASIKDFFGSGNSFEMVRPTHGTSGQCCNWNCNTICCFCLPTTATSWTMEMWGQGGGGAGSCCCMWGCRGGSGADYGYHRHDTGTWSCGSAQSMCNCVCMCNCCSPTADGHPGQFSRVTNCQDGACMCVGGGQSGCNCCNYGGTPSYLNDICPSFDFCAGSAGGGSTSSGSVSVKGWANLSQQCWNPCQQGDPFTGWGGGNSGGGSGGLDEFFPASSGCSSGWHKCGSYQNSSLQDSRCGSFGFSRLNGQCNVACIRGGGGASYAGGFINECCGNVGNWAYTGWTGDSPGGGGTGAGSCGGGCCCGGWGGMGAILMSWDT